MEAQEIVTALLKAGMTQGEIEKETNIPQPTISKLKHGKKKDMRLSDFRALESLYAKQKVRIQRIARAQQESQQFGQTPAAA